jgi:hypothetical protein
MVKQKLGRNDPCWCGSGRKLKKCHGTAERYQPKQATFHVPESRRPKPIVTHLEKYKDEWVERPGLLAVRLVTGDPGDIDVELTALRSRWGNLLQSHSVPYRVSHAVTSRLNDIQHKLRGVRYHRENFDRHETDMELQFSTAAPPTGAEMEQKVPGLVFEVEGFLYQTKSALDMLAQVLRDAGFQSVGESFGDHGERILGQLQAPPKSCRQEAQTLIEIVTKAQTTWIDQVISMRDHIAHRSMIDVVGPSRTT